MSGELIRPAINRPANRHYRFGMSEETQPDVTAGTEESAETAPAAPQPDWAAAYGSMVRFAAGLVGVAREGLDQAASAAQSADPAEELPEDESARGSVLIGFAADLPNRFGGVAESVEGGTRLFAGTVSAGWRMLAASPVGRLAAMPVDAVRSIVDAESERLAAIGRHEVIQGRALVHSVVDDTDDRRVLRRDGDARHAPCRPRARRPGYSCGGPHRPFVDVGAPPPVPRTL